MSWAWWDCHCHRTQEAGVVGLQGVGGGRRPRGQGRSRDWDQITGPVGKQGEARLGGGVLAL